jgi:hypothetical protein
MTNGVEICLIYCEVWRKERSVGSKRQAEVSMDRASRDTYVFVTQATEDIGGRKCPQCSLSGFQVLHPYFLSPFREQGS